MKARKHISFDRVFAYLTEGNTDILWFESEDLMRRAGECLVELARSDENPQKDGDVVVVKAYDKWGINVQITTPVYLQGIRFAYEKQMRRAGQCLIDLARIGGNEVEIKDKTK